MSTSVGPVPRRAGHDGCPVGSRAFERRYRFRQASWRLVRHGSTRTMADDTVSWFAAVDWGSAQHQACVLDSGGAIVGERAFPHGGAGPGGLFGLAGGAAGGGRGPPGGGEGAARAGG